MDVYNYFNQENSSGTMKTEISKFDSDAFLEYKRRVFQQLASEYDKEKQQQEKANRAVAGSHQAPNTDNLHASVHQQNNARPDPDELFRPAHDLQPSWDDSDLQSETYFLPSSNNFVNNTLPLQKNRVSKPVSQEATLQPEKLSRSDNDLNSKDSRRPLMDWPSFDEQIKLKSSKAESDESFRSSDSVDVTSPMTTRRWRGKMSFQKQKLDREAIRQKLSMTDPDEDDQFKREKPWSRSYSNSSHLHICYINDSCSSGESDDDKPGVDTPPLISPASPGMRSDWRKYRSRTSDSSSVSSPPDSSIVQRTHHQDARSVRNKQEELEMEARYELYQAHQRAKALAEQEKIKGTNESKSSLAHRVLSGSLSEATSLKMRQNSLSRSDCRLMTLGQLQLLLNDMHAKKQALNDQLMSLLISRDEYQTEQDAKLTDIDDLKSMMSEVGPETTV